MGRVRRLDLYLNKVITEKSLILLSISGAHLSPTRQSTEATNRYNNNPGNFFAGSSHFLFCLSFIFNFLYFWNVRKALSESASVFAKPPAKYITCKNLLKQKVGLWWWRDELKYHLLVTSNFSNSVTWILGWRKKTIFWTSLMATILDFGIKIKCRKYYWKIMIFLGFTLEDMFRKIQVRFKTLIKEKCYFFHSPALPSRPTRLPTFKTLPGLYKSLQYLFLILAKIV